jgi:hypothetical protein
MRQVRLLINNSHARQKSIYRSLLTQSFRIHFQFYFSYILLITMAPLPTIKSLISVFYNAKNALK